MHEWSSRPRGVGPASDEPSASHAVHVGYWVDRLFLGLSRPRTLFRRGWGDVRFIDRMQEFSALVASREPGPIDLRVESDTAYAGIRVSKGTFRSPAADDLPPEAGDVTVWLVSGAAGASLSGRDVCVHLAGSGDEGLSRRLRALAIPLARRGIVSILLENPLYGVRRPAGQRTTDVGTVSEFMAMFHAAVVEAIHLMQWAKAEGARAVGVTGISMGGQASAVAGASFRRPVATIPCLAPVCISSEYAFGPLSRLCAWDVLAADCGGSVEAARQRLRKVLRVADLRLFPTPVDVGATILVSGRDDAIVPAHLSRDLATHWQAEQRWLPHGHVTAFLMHRKTFCRAIVDAFAHMLRRDTPYERSRGAVHFPASQSGPSRRV